MKKVVAVIDSLVTTKEGIFFPNVRAWCEIGGKEYHTSDLEKVFPVRGNVFLHVSACDGAHPALNSVGLFFCSEEDGSKSAKWSVKSLQRTLFPVVECGLEYKGNEFDLWEWLHYFQSAPPCQILAWTGVAYVLTKDGFLIGQFNYTPEGRLIAREQIHLYENVSCLSTRVAGRQLQFIDSDLLPQGRHIIVDPREAIQRRLKASNKAAQIDWLSRAKVQQLSSALANATSVEGTEWVQDKMTKGLEILTQAGTHDAHLIEELLNIPKAAVAIEHQWKLRNTKQVEECDRTLREKKDALVGIQEKIRETHVISSELEAKRDALLAEISSLNIRQRDSIVAAEKSFGDELKRLAHSPASIALFASWSASASSSQRVGCVHRLESLQAASQTNKSLQETLTRNFRAVGLSPPSAAELAVVCAAAFVAGQPISIRSPAIDLLAIAIANSLGGKKLARFEISAGILDPIDWQSAFPECLEDCHIIFNGANRSDLGLVFGSRRIEFVAKALGYRNPASLLILGLDSSADIEVESDLHLGPVIDEKWLNFTQLMQPTEIISWESSNHKFEPALPEELAALGNTIATLRILEHPTGRLILRRALGALQSLQVGPNDIFRILFKYWCLPFSSPSEVKAVIADKASAWSQDRLLIGSQDKDTDD